MDIGFAKNSDIKSWMELLENVKEHFPGLELVEYAKGLQKRINAKCALVAKAGDKVIGALLFSKASMELEFLAVHPDFRRMGVAESLVRFMFSLVPKGSTFVVITYREEDSLGKAARKLYGKIGFVPGKLVVVFDYPCQEYTYVT